jgi:hypothetical protein
MAATIYRSAAVANATYGTPDVSGLIVTGFTITESAETSEMKDDQGGVVAVSVSEPIKEISIEGMRTGTFSQSVGGALTVSMPAGHTLGLTTIVTSIETTFAAEEFEQISLDAKSYTTAMTAEDTAED